MGNKKNPKIYELNDCKFLNKGKGVGLICSNERIKKIKCPIKYKAPLFFCEEFENR